jgi:GT2 family glycosyltransferase
LYHWRKVPGSTAARYDDKSFADEAARKALQEFLDRNRPGATIEKGFFPSTFRVKHSLQKPEKISIIIPFRDKVNLLRSCLNSIFDKTYYSDFEILLISNNSQEEGTFDYVNEILAESDKIRFFEYNVPFNFSRINNWAVKQAKGSCVLLLNNDTEVISNGWLTAMYEHIQRPDVGAVGAQLVYPDHTIQHGGIILNIQGIAGHAHKYLPDDFHGYFSRLNVIQNFSACTAACLLVRKDLFQKVGGLDEEKLKIAFNDVDLCLKIRQEEFLIVYTPYAKLYHFESKSRGLDTSPEKQKRFREEVRFFQNKWEKVLEAGDPFYNPNLSLKSENFDLNLSYQI